MEIPNGYTEEEVISIITNILNNIAAKYTFGIYSVEDIKQEGFILCCSILTKYDGTWPLENFLRVSLNNRLKDFKRDNYIRLDRACSKCANFNKNCEGCKKRQKKQEIKLNLLNAIDIHLVHNEKNASYENNLLDNLEMVELVEKINKKLPVQYREDYLRLKEGLYVSKSRRDEIEKIITEIIEENE